MKNIVFITGMIFATTTSFAADTKRVKIPNIVNATSSGEGMSAIPAAGQVTVTGSEDVTVRIINNCFPTNLRSAGNPVSPDGIITASLNIVGGSVSMPITLNYPGLVTAQGGFVGGAAVQPIDPSLVSLPAGSSAAIYGNIVEVRIPLQFESTVNPDGSIKTNKNTSVYVQSSAFTQTMRTCDGGAVYGAYGQSATVPAYPCGDYMGKSGPLDATISPAVVSADRSLVELTVSFPGQTGFCGGYYSPLMVFWDDQRPLFTGVSNFPLHPGSQSAWPEAEAPGSFIGLDLDGNAKIDKKLELFGDTDDHKNGFEALRVLDTDKNGVIDAGDKDFKKLVLWNDKNGDGISQKSELTPLHARIKQISLKYQASAVMPIGKNAEQREKSVAIDKKTGKSIQVVDIWLRPLTSKVATKDPAQ